MIAKPSNQGPVTVAIVGAGNRSLRYAQYALEHPDRMRVVAVADPDPTRRQKVAQTYGLPGSALFESYEELAMGAKVADAVINGTMDHLHYVSAMPLLHRGYHMLLEKPIAPTEREVRDLIAAADAHRATVMICHVMRYTLFYQAVQEMLAQGRIGEVISMHTAENVSHHHMAVAFVRGRWNKTAESNPMLLAKCCHDMDLIAWFMSGQRIKRVASFGSLKYFRPENAPPGSADRCLSGCQIEASCPYSARTNYITQGLWQQYVWENLRHLKDPTLEQKIESLRTDNPYGRCVWHCDNDVVDHQSVLIEFENGATASHDMFCNAVRPGRSIHIVGTQGELLGEMESKRLTVRKPSLSADVHFTEEVVELKMKSDSHGGGDERLIEDFVNVLRGERPSPAVTRIQDSLNGHLISFAADTAMREGRVVELS